MDAQGDFVITWQSNNQDGSGYGIYAQAYNAAGQVVGGTDEVQAIDFTNGFTGTFRSVGTTTTTRPRPTWSRRPSPTTATPRPSVAAIQSALAGDRAPTSTSWPTA